MSVSCFCWVAIEPGWCGVGRSSGPSACPCPGAYLPPCHHALHAISLASPVPGRPGRRVPVPYLSANSPANPDHHRHLRYRLSVPGRVSSCHVLSPRAESRIILCSLLTRSRAVPSIYCCTLTGRLTMRAPKHAPHKGRGRAHPHQSLRYQGSKPLCKARAQSYAPFLSSVGGSRCRPEPPGKRAASRKTCVGL